MENQREYYLEHHRELQYAKSLIDDLKVDTMVIQRTLNEKITVSKMMDSLINILDSGDIVRSNELIYYYERYMTFDDPFTSQDVTYQQLRSSGNFRYMSNAELYKQISDYYNLYDRYLLLVESKSESLKDHNEMEARLFNAKDLSGLLNSSAQGYLTLYSRPAGKLHPVKNDEYYLNYLAVAASNAKFNREGAVIFLSWLKDKATGLLKELNAEYHFD